MIFYEYPFNERIRTYLRLEQLFVRLGVLMQREAALDHHFALVSLFEMMEVAARADLKAEVLKDLEKQRHTLNGFRGNPSISEGTLDEVIVHLEACFSQLNQQTGKIGQLLSDHEWLMSIRSRIGIPGGTCSFDMPSYHAWQHQPAVQRQADLRDWLMTFDPLMRSVSTLLQLLRGSGVPKKMLAAHGHYQQSLPQGRPFQLLRLSLPEGVIPEISCNRLLVSVRILHLGKDGKHHPMPEDVDFELTLCA